LGRIQSALKAPTEIISHTVRPYHVFSLSLRDVELILPEPGILVIHETSWHWRLKFGADFARALRPRRPQLSIRIRGVLHHFWRPVDQHGTGLDVLKLRWSVTTAAKAR
jgi:putative transposase